jgi:hypothetical protein
MQATLDAQGTLHIPARPQPYYIDGPLVLKSGQKLSADPTAEIRLKPGSNTCMVRNEHVVTSNTKPVPGDLQFDTDITIEGGIWTTLANAVDSMRQSRPFGVHVNGPASAGLVRGVRGDSHDDDVALNAWEWKNYGPSYGPIKRIIVEDVTGWPEDDHEGNIATRPLPGVKRFDDGTTLDCPIRDITLRRITDIRHFKIYDQPNLELGRGNDFSIGVGSVKNHRLEDLTFNRSGQIELYANTDGLSIHNVCVNHPITPDWHLLAIGPLSQTSKRGKSEDAAKWVEIFSPDLDCTVRNLTVSDVRNRDSQADLPIEQVVEVIEQKINPDYPKTTPRGGTGEGIWIR